MPESVRAPDPEMIREPLPVIGALMVALTPGSVMIVALSVGISENDPDPAITKPLVENSIPMKEILSDNVTVPAAPPKMALPPFHAEFAEPSAAVQFVDILSHAPLPPLINPFADAFAPFQYGVGNKAEAEIDAPTKSALKSGLCTM